MGAAPPEALQQIAVVLANVLYKQLLQQCRGALCLLCSFTSAKPAVPCEKLLMLMQPSFCLNMQELGKDMPGRYLASTGVPVMY